MRKCSCRPSPLSTTALHSGHMSDPLARTLALLATPPSSAGAVRDGAKERVRGGKGKRGRGGEGEKEREGERTYYLDERERTIIPHSLHICG